MRSYYPGYTRRKSRNPSLDENEEIRNLIKKSGLEKKEFLTKAFKPLNAKISSARGELIAIHTRTYEKIDLGSDPNEPSHLGLEERTQVGLITDKTSIENEFNLSRLIDNVKVIYPQNSFSSQPETSFSLLSFNFALPLIYFKDRPPAIAEGEERLGIHEKRSRLEIYIGDNESTSFLQKTLKGYEYMVIRRLSGRGLPIGNEIALKIRNEQFEVYEQARNAILLLSKLVQRRDARLSAIKGQGGEAAFNHGTHIEFTSEISEQLRFKENTDGVQRSLSRALYQAKARNYHEDGMTLEIQEDQGVKKIIDVKEYFSHKLQDYSHLLK